MNKRIQELYEQSWVEGSYQQSIPVEFVGDEQRYRTVKTSNFDHKHFAELIVRECAKVADDWYTNPDGKEITWHIDTHLKKHFGVEE